MEEFITIDTDQPTAIRVTCEPYHLVPEEDPILKQKINPFVFDGKTDAKELSKRLIQTLKNHGAYGLAANQCGLSHRVFVMGAENEYMTVFNPEILSVSEEKVHLDEGCLSFPFLVLKITRPKVVSVKFQDENGIHRTMSLTGFSGRVFQHETDHLNGITFDTVAKPLALKMSKKAREKRIKNVARELVGQRRFINEVTR